MASSFSVRRLFTNKERLVLLAASEGCCRACGVELRLGFDADHIIPFARGGATDVVNGQALCPSCNRAKGAKTPADAAGQLQKTSEPMITPSLDPTEAILTGTALTEAAVTRPSDVARLTDREAILRAASLRSASFPVSLTPPLRPWQRRGVNLWLDQQAQRRNEQGRNDMMVVACPGAGKTNLALYLARLELAADRCNLLVIVVPTRQLKRQWARAAHRAGLILTACWGNGAAGPPTGVDGVLITYSQLARLPEAVRLLCGRHRVFACFDEIHHGGDGLSWGDGLREGFEGAEARLCLSGTPFRTDGLNLPFVRYDRWGRVVSDVCYGYAQALADQVVRPAFFHACGGRFQWRDSGGVHCADFTDRLGDTGQARRLRAALSAAGNWLTSVLGRADQALRVARRTHVRAKAFVVCIDSGHARAVAQRLCEITGEDPTLALSDDPDSADALERFRRDGSAWLVVCRMAGEGFDCPDLRVCVWATNVISELFFRQVVGRVLRMVTGLSYQDGTIFLPADSRLTAIASSFMEEPGTLQKPGGGQQESTLWSSAPAGAASGRFAVLSSEADGVEVLSGGAIIRESSLRDAQDLKAARLFLADLPDHYVAAMLAEVEAGACEFEETGLSEEGAWATLSDALTASGAVNAARQSLPHLEIAGNLAVDDSEVDDGEETYDERVIRLRRECRRLTALIAGELGSSAMEIERFYRAHLGFGQIGATLAQLGHKHEILQRKVNELQAAEG